MTAIASAQARPNREYKDSVFRDLFGSPDRKEYALSLYNALNGTSYDDPEALEVTTLEDVVYLSRKNDASYLIDGRLVLWEQQSTPNPNMPLRGLGYLARLYEGWVAANDYNVHSSSLIRLPRPQYYVFYVGVTAFPDRCQLRLSDAFGHSEDVGEPALEVVAEVVNINYGRNEGLMGECEALAGYARFVALAREYNGTMERGDAIRAAIDACIAEGTLADYFRARKGEVLEMFLTDWSEEEQRRLDDIEKQRRYEEGREEGREEDRREMLARAAGLVRDGKLDMAAASMVLGVPEADLTSVVKAGEAKMFLTDWSEEEQRRLDDIEKQRRFEEGREEGERIGREEGRKEGREEGERKGYEKGERIGREKDRREMTAHIIDLVRAGEVNVAAASAILGVPEADILAQVG